MKLTCFLATLYFFFVSLAAQEYVEATPIAGKGVAALLLKYRLASNGTALDAFYQINDMNENKPVLQKGRKYKLPIRIFIFNGKNIRTTIGITDFNSALAIQHYNEDLARKKIRSKTYKNDKQLWVPLVEFVVKGNRMNPPLHSETVVRKIESSRIDFPLFGENSRSVEIIDYSLEGVTFYLVGGHGGPDPGAIGKKNGNTLHEDEYAYDVILRLGKKILEHGGDIEVIIEDAENGIRDDIYLQNNKTETCDGEKIPLNQLERLKQRVDRINYLYDKNENGNTKHHFISIHVDSRGRKDSQIDIFFYHSEGSSEGERIADALRDKMEDKYHQAQPGRGYKGSVRHRGLYVIRKTKPVSTFIELGNIQNPRDQKRILHPDNRQAIANWLTEGLIEYYQQ